jgi:hypothetical protein
MTEQNSITPPPELARQWRRTAPHPSNEHEHYYYITLCAAQWGADQELEACVQWTIDTPAYQMTPGALRAARRPKPPSLKEQAIAALSEMSIEPCLINDVDVNAAVCAKYNTIRRALEALDD